MIDRQCFEVLADSIRKTRAFNQVTFGLKPSPIGDYPCAWIAPRKRKETSDHDDDDKLVTWLFQVTIEIRERSDDPDRSFDELLTLTETVRKAFESVADPPWFAHDSSIDEVTYGVGMDNPKRDSFASVAMLGKMTFDRSRALPPTPPVPPAKWYANPWIPY